MKNIELYRWVQGYLELCPDDVLTLQQTYILRNHLNLVQGVEGYLGEYNTMLYAHTEVVVQADVEEQLPALHQLHDFMKAKYTGIPT